MGFPTLEMAEKAFQETPWKYIGKKDIAIRPALLSDSLIGKPIEDSICVDAACSGNPGVLEYRGVDTKSGAQLFHQGPFPEGTVNLGEFLGIVHALAYLKQRNCDWPVYSDSRTAIAWMKKKEIKTTLPRTEKNKEVFDLIDRALKWIRENSWPNKILKWETEHWGEIPADFGRK
jgi:ribonuclease HI